VLRWSLAKLATLIHLSEITLSFFRKTACAVQSDRNAADGIRWSSGFMRGTGRRDGAPARLRKQEAVQDCELFRAMCFAVLRLADCLSFPILSLPRLPSAPFLPNPCSCPCVCLCRVNKCQSCPPPTEKGSTNELSFLCKAMNKTRSSCEAWQSPGVCCCCPSSSG
jgi:hypothetical protein